MAGAVEETAPAFFILYVCHSPKGTPLRDGVSDCKERRISLLFEIRLEYEILRRFAPQNDMAFHYPNHAFINTI